MKKLAVGFIGMGHLGLTMAAASLSKGCRVICFDPNSELIDDLVLGRYPIEEAGLEQAFAEADGNVNFTTNLAELDTLDIVYISEDVPTNDKGVSDLSSIRSLIHETSSTLSETTIRVILSQIPPGFMRGLSKSYGVWFYQVETLIFGMAMQRALYPAQIIVGLPSSEVNIPEKWLTFLKMFRCPLIPMVYESAELTKIAINCYLAASVSVTNSLAAISENIGAFWPDIADALRRDNRIGQHAYLTPGLGISGGNLERDIATISNLANETGCDSEVFRSFKNNSNKRKNWILDHLHRSVMTVIKEPRITILGIAYKAGTDSLKNAPSVSLIKQLPNAELTIYDPVVKSLKSDHPRLSHSTSALEACKEADVVVILTPWPEFNFIEPGSLKNEMRGKLVLDPFDVLDAEKSISTGLTRFVLGQSNPL